VIFNNFNKKQTQDPLSDSELHDETTFYQRFVQDLDKAKEEVIIESPFISAARMRMLYTTIARLISRNVKVYIFTRDPSEHNEEYDTQSELEIKRFERLGVQVLICVGNHHRKLAIIDRQLLWEGSLNILSQIHSREIMRRIEGKSITLQMFKFLNLEKFL
jgi:phosphatidylserine/phosphatidylglycerophosphate/cardiolipin synthase-like enzyme